MSTRKGELGCPNCDGPCIGCWEEQAIPESAMQAARELNTKLGLAEDEHDVCGIARAMHLYAQAQVRAERAYCLSVAERYNSRVADEFRWKWSKP